MEKYLITNKTIALLKNDKKTIMINVDKVEVFNINIKKIIEYSCNYYGSSLNGRLSCAKIILNLKYKVPILIDDKNNIILIQLCSPRNTNSLYLVTNKIVNFDILANFLQIFCINGTIFKLKLSKSVLEKLLIKSIQLNNILNWRKNSNLL